MQNKSSLSTEENMKLTELKRQLINANCDQERTLMLEEVEQLLNKAKLRYKFLSTLDHRKHAK
ncbi:hypothetical protein M3204_18995 [Mesobacillus subterraneus]|uniref:hypothetical protein n=1 Tax=Mesobacillus subterraneus TaxID=285983 RepID=UPI00203DB935|nr:hypothetical protein [Mesobacillus subterraneus]MCM3666511.1 hypothetical protein [Mesobacillus subterraneus]MCM3686123.1 hypothetical protein [Mesobacillus subterraneus]